MDLPKLIFNLRTQKGITQSELAYGIMPVSDLSRLETGEKEQPFIVVEALIQRLGKSSFKFEVHMDNTEYQHLFMHQLLAYNLRSEKSLFDKLYETYKDDTEGAHVLHRQYGTMIAAGREIISTNDPGKAIQLLQQSIEMTLPDWRTFETKRYLCTQEIQILLLLSLCYLEKEEYNVVRQIVTRVRKVLKKQLTDEEEISRLRPLLCYVEADLYYMNGDKDCAKDVLREGLASVKRSGLLTMALELLELKIICDDDSNEALCQRDAIMLFYKNTGVEKQWNACLQFIQLNQHREYVLVHELIKDVRQAQGISQEELSWEICATETLSRIECGNRKPQKNKRIQLYRKLKLDEIPFELLDTEDFEIYEKERELRALISEKRYMEAEQLLKQIESSINKSKKPNLQFIGRMKTYLMSQKGTITNEYAISTLIHLLKETYIDFSGEIYRIPTRNEFQILLQIALLKKRSGDTEAAKELYLALYNKYQGSIVLEDHHAREVLLLYIHLTSLFSQMGEYEKVTDYALRGFRLALRCQRGDVLGLIGINLSAAYYSLGEPKIKEYAGCIKASIQLLRFYLHEKEAAKLQEFMEQHQLK